MVSLIAAPDDGERIEAGVASREGFVGVPFLLGDNDHLERFRAERSQLRPSGAIGPVIHGAPARAGGVDGMAERAFLQR